MGRGRRNRRVRAVGAEGRRNRRVKAVGAGTSLKRRRSGDKVAVRTICLPLAFQCPYRGGASEAQKSPAELLISVLRGLSASCLQQQSWICTFDYPSVQSWGRSASGERTASMSEVGCCS